MLRGIVPAMKSGPACLAVLLAPLAAADAGPPALEPGNWMYSMQVVANGKPQPPQTGEECLEAQVKDLAAYFTPKVEGAELACDTQRKADGNAIEYALRCKGSAMTLDGLTRVTIEDARRVTIRSQLLTRTMYGDNLVLSKGEALRTGRCRKP